MWAAGGCRGHDRDTATGLTAAGRDRPTAGGAGYPASVRPGTTIAIIALLVLILGAAIIQFVFHVGA